MENILIFGNGYVAGNFVKYFSALPAKDRPAFQVTKADIVDAPAVRAVLASVMPTVVINCAGKTGRPNIDWCEDNSFDAAKGQTWLDSNQGKTWRSNVLGPTVLASCCIEKNIFLAHVSSGCIYSGDNKGKGFSEDDAPNFKGSFYSRTKIASEQALDLIPNEAGILQLRLRMPIDSTPSPRNFITKITRYPKVISIPNSISVLDDFVKASHELIRMRASGIYNVTNQGSLSHAEILDMYKEIVDPSINYKIITIDELYSMTVAKRSNCVLSNAKLQTKLKEAKMSMPLVKDAVRKALVEYKRILDAGDSQVKE